jgi:hypothetical protein
MRPLLAALLPLLLLAGCSPGEKVVAVRGRLLRDGQPLGPAAENLPPGDKGIRVVFYPLTPDAAGPSSYPAVVNPKDATFTLAGGTAKGVPPGKYRVSVAQGAFGSADALKGAFGKENSPLTIDVPAGGSLTLDVDVGTKTVTVK